MTIQEYSKIVTWLFTNDGGYPDKTKWRKAFMEMLERMVDEWYPKDVKVKAEDPGLCVCGIPSDWSHKNLTCEVQEKSCPCPSCRER